MKLGPSILKIEVVWFDEDMLELKLSVSNAHFAGQSNFYVALDEPMSLAKSIEGFPNSDGDVREFEFGSSGIAGYGGAKLCLLCKDRRGHLVMQVSVYMNSIDRNEVASSAIVQLEVVPADIDLFVMELRRMKTQVGEVAVLQSTT